MLFNRVFEIEASIFMTISWIKNVPLRSGARRALWCSVGAECTLALALAGVANAAIEGRAGTAAGRGAGRGGGVSIIGSGGCIARGGANAARPPLAGRGAAGAASDAVETAPRCACDACVEGGSDAAADAEEHSQSTSIRKPSVSMQSPGDGFACALLR